MNDPIVDLTDDSELLDQKNWSYVSLNEQSGIYINFELDMGQLLISMILFSWLVLWALKWFYELIRGANHVR